MNEDSPSPSHSKNPLEWIVFAISLVLVIGMVGVLVHQFLSVGDGPPHLRVALGLPEVLPDQLRVPVTLHNDGDQPAASIQIEVSASLEGSENRTTLFFDHIAHHSQREGWVTFPGDAAPAGFEARVMGYANP